MKATYCALYDLPALGSKAGALWLYEMLFQSLYATYGGIIKENVQKNINSFLADLKNNIVVVR